MAVQIKNRYGKEITLLNPNEKAGKYAEELRCDFKLTNNHEAKLDKDGFSNPLTASEKAYRSGYLAARRDSADVHLAKTNPEKLKASKLKRREKRRLYRLGKK